MCEPIGQVQFLAFAKFTRTYYTKLQEKSCCYLLMIYMKKQQRKARQTYALLCNCNLHLYYNFALVLYKNALIFTQSEACKFFMYIIIIDIQ